MNKTGFGEESYKVDAKCSNCSHVGTISATKGFKIDGAYPCPNCGCNTFKKTWN